MSAHQQTASQWPPREGPPFVPAYPVRLEAELDEPLSRWLWLVKWVLLIPHCIVLAFLFIGYAVVTLIALFAIVITGDYAHWAFRYTTGVLRWGWRVQYYGYGVLGTDRYPPFTLAEVPGYPARIAIDYPEHPSRCKALVQWWLLPIPHFLIVAIVVGVSDSARNGVDGQTIVLPGLISLLTLCAGVGLLFTAAYPRGIWSFVVGLNRWVYRVTAYASLMTDRYPPFRLDQGGTEPVSGAEAVSAQALR